MRFTIEEMLMAVSYLTTAKEEGFRYICYPKDQDLYRGDDLISLRNRPAAVKFAAESNYQYAGKLKPFLKHMNRIVQQTDLPAIINTTDYNHLLKRQDMNRNVEERFRDEAKAFKVPAEMIEKAIGLMEKGLPYFSVKGQLPANKGTKDLTIHVKQGGRYDNYYLNRYDLALSKSKPLEEGKKYFVITKDEKGEPQFKKITSAVEAIENFQKRSGDAELAVGKSIKDYMQLATMKEGKVDYVTKDFQAVYYSPPITNTVYVDGGTGFNVVQAGNMLEGGSAYRSDLVSRVGQGYEAWNVYRFNEPRDKYGNLKIKQFSEGYGFDLKKELENYRIKGIEKPEKFNSIMEDLKDGSRPVVTVVNDKGEEMSLRMQAMPRFGNVNFYHLNGKPENREQFQKVVKQGKDQSQGKDRERSESQEMSI